MFIQVSHAIRKSYQCTVEDGFSVTINYKKYARTLVFDTFEEAWSFFFKKASLNLKCIEEIYLLTWADEVFESCDHHFYITEG